MLHSIPQTCIVKILKLPDTQGKLVTEMQLGIRLRSDTSPGWKGENRHAHHASRTSTQTALHEICMALIRNLP